MNKKIIVSVVVVLIIVGGAVFGVLAMRSNKADSNMPTPASSSSSSSSSSSASGDTSKAVTATAVAIGNFAFNPQVIRVKVGQKVTWTNKDSTQHRVVADTTSADAPDGSPISQNQTYSFTFMKAGTYTYHCGIHSDMKATVVVD